MFIVLLTSLVNASSHTKCVDIPKYLMKETWYKIMF